jgi:hypothetical protein
VLETATADEFGRERVVWYWYEVDGSRTLSRRTVRARLALGAFGDPAAAAIVALSARCRRNCDEARALLTTAYRAGLDGASAGTRSVTAVATSSTPSGIDTGGSAS